jgi:lipid II:glycine glycyltransferase (peptidoglycan interpeptide bridge formation enzyme)
MSDYQVREMNDESNWEDFVTAQPEANFLHSWNWGKFNQRIGKDIIRFGVYRSQHLCGVVLAIIEEAKRGRFIVVPAGPLLEWDDDEATKACFDAIRKFAKSKRAVFVRIRPQLIDTDTNRARFSELGLHVAPMYLHAEHTSQLDLTWNQDDILAAMRKNTRYEIRKSEKLGIRIETTTDEAKLRDFYNLQIETSKRHNFIPFTYEYLHEQFKVFKQDNQVVLYSSYLENELLAQAFVIFYGKEAAYHYGASTEKARKFPGAYALQWRAILDARDRGMERYNFWGVTKPEEKDHRFYGVSVFKRGFGGKDIIYLHAHDMIINKPRYLVNYIVEVIRKRRRRV